MMTPSDRTSDASRVLVPHTAGCDLDVSVLGRDGHQIKAGFFTQEMKNFATKSSSRRTKTVQWDNNTVHLYEDYTMGRT